MKSFSFWVALLLVFQLANAQRGQRGLGLGVRAGYTFGKNGGWTIGADVSHTWGSSRINGGIILAYDYILGSGITKTSLGGFYKAVPHPTLGTERDMTWTPGFILGVSWISMEIDGYYALSVSAFVEAEASTSFEAVIPYLDLTYHPNRPGLLQTGLSYRAIVTGGTGLLPF